MKSNEKAIALESRLKQCNSVLTLGVRTNFSDYSPHDAQLIREAPKIYYPTTFYADLFDAIGKTTFPSYHNYKCVQDKISQTALFNLAGIPHPRTRVFYGKRKVPKILDRFRFPFIGKIPRGSAMGKGVWLIRNEEELFTYCERVSVAYIQEYLAVDRDIRVVVIGDRVRHAYWRIAGPGEFRSNVSLGGRIRLDGVPAKALELALFTARSCGWNDVGMDICLHDGGFLVLEANMKYGKEGFRAAGMDYYQLMDRMIENGEI